MRRVRITLLLLLVGLAVPVVLLVTRALQSVELEQRVRHQAVADRVFDEMERALSEFLAREETRAPDAYRFYVWRDGGPGDAPKRSVLSRPPGEPFVLAHFQIDPDGTVRSPLVPADTAAAERAGDWPPSSEQRESAEAAQALLASQVEPFWREARERKRALAAAPAEAPPSPDAEALEEAVPRLAFAVGPNDGGAKGSLQRQKKEGIALGAPKKDAGLDPGVEERADDEDAEAEQRASAYDVLRSLNVGAQQRAARKQKVTVAPRRSYEAPDSIGAEPLLADAPEAGQASSASALRESEPMQPRADSPAPATAPLPSAAEPDPATESRALGQAIVADVLGREGAGARAPSPAAARRAPEAVAEREEDGLAAAASEAFAALTAPYGRSADIGATAAPAATDPDRVRVVLEPMAGQLVGDGLLMLYRTVLVDGRGYRQGLLVDRAALGAWLYDTVVGAGPLAGLARVRFEGDPGGLPGAGGHVARHRFAEPFQGLAAELRVGPLREIGTAWTIWALAALLAVVAVIGALAVYRMVAVVVHFAERRSNFVAAVSHELKTPLTAIRMHGEMLRDDLVPAEGKRKEYYRTITDESERLSRLIDNVLEFSRLEKGGRPLSISVGSPAPVIEDIVERLRPHAEREGFRIGVEIEDGIPPVRFDRDALAQVIFNLVDNALKYGSQSDRKQIDVRCERDRDGRVVVSVRDFGPGVPREHLARIFEPFFRAEDELTRTTKGSGIGLSLVKQLADAMGAAVTGDNPEGGGFRVRIALAGSATS